MMPLPIDAVLGDLKAALAFSAAAVLQAPPGSGKTTRVPLALLDEPWLAGRRIVMLEPRRLAARAAAVYMAGLLGEPVGRTVGYRVRMDTCVGPQTRIEVVTEGVLTRLMQRDASLAGTGLVIFDEFHERHLEADLGLALCLDLQGVLNPDLKLATNIAETSLTIEGIRVVVDSGLARVPWFDVRSGMTRLVTLPVARASPPTSAAAEPAARSRGRASGCGPRRPTAA